MTLTVLARASARAACLVAVLLLCSCSEAPRFDFSVPPTFSVRDPVFVDVMESLAGRPACGGNRVTILRNGGEAYPAMLKAIAEAQRSVSFETYLFWDSKIAREFVDAIAERAQAGVQVRLMLDSWGCRHLGRRLIKKLRSAGARVEFFNKLKPCRPRDYFNRTHRKIMVVDGKVGFIGGLGVHDDYAGNGDSPGHWRDTHARIEGPVVRQLQSAFAQNWLELTHELLVGPEHYPELKRVGDHQCQIFTSTPLAPMTGPEVFYLIVLSAARESIYLATAYFVPHKALLRELTAAAQRGVDVRLILPGSRIDVPAVRYAARRRYGKLLKAGVRIYEYQPSCMHAKTVVVDGYWATIGSANLDNWSFRFTYEANLNVYGEDFAAQMKAMFEDDLTRCKEITLENWENRPWSDRLAEEVTTHLDDNL